MNLRASGFALSLAAAVSVFVPGGSVVAGPCDIDSIAPSLTISAPQGGGFYDVFSPDPEKVQFRVTVENTTGAPRECRVIFELANGGTVLRRSGGGDRLDFDLTNNNGNNSFLVPAGDRPPGRNFNVGPNAQRGRNYRFFIDEEQFVSPGTYERTVIVSTFIRGQRGNIRDQETITFRTEVEPQGALFISVLGEPDPQANASFKTAFLDFGSITKTNSSGEVRFLIQSNSGFGLTVSSQNNGQMLLRDAAAETTVNGFTNAIPYTVNSRQVTTVPVEFFDQVSSTSQQGARENFVIQLDTGADTRSDIDVPEGVLSGRYQDVLTFTVVPE